MILDKSHRMNKISSLKARLHTLGDIQSILGAMKNLAVIEMNRVSKLMDTQKRALATLTAALADFEEFYPGGVAPSKTDAPVFCLLIGSERGFCGPFNERVIEAFHEVEKTYKPIQVAVMGRKLASKLEGRTPVDLTLDGPNSADEIQKLIDNLSLKLLPYANHRWLFIHNNGDPQTKEMASFPLEIRHRLSREYSSPPIFNMTPEELYPQLLEQYLLAVLQNALSVSFFSENRERLHHMEGALHHLEKDNADLTLALNTHRQEEITDEIEILMLALKE